MSDAGFRHTLLTYADDAELAETAAPFLARGVDDGEHVLAAVSPSHEDVLRNALGPNAAGVTFIDNRDQYARPEWTLATYDGVLRRLAADGARRIRVYGELADPYDTPQECDAWIAYEAILNAAFAHHPASLLCGYDKRAAPERVVTAMQRTHPVLAQDGGRPCRHFEDPAEVVRSLRPQPRAVPPMHPGPVDAGPRGLRVWLTRAMEDAGLGREAAEDMLLAAGEVLGNAYRFGASVPGIRVGSEGATFVLEVSADAPWSDDPLAGYLPPRSGASSGAGLWIARQLTSHLELSQGSAGGLVVRLWA